MVIFQSWLKFNAFCACVLLGLTFSYYVFLNGKSCDSESTDRLLSSRSKTHTESLVHHNQLPSNLIDTKLPFHEVYEPRPLSFANYRYSDASNPQISQDVKVILMWTPWNGLWETVNYYHLRPGNESFTSFLCPNQKCYVTRDEQHLERADAVFFHLLDIERRPLPTFRRPEQMWILYIMEAPWQVRVGMSKLRSLFNWTMSFRDDSDIVVKYGFTGKRQVPLPPTTIFLPNGTLSEKDWIVLFVSDCKTESAREDYVRELGRHINVDVYGLCGTKKCFPSQSDVCYQKVLKNYKFYLSFENSLCRDYVTEKFFNVLGYNIVPVVFGMANYSQIAPPGSYIDAMKYPNPSDLAKFLKKVGSDEILYSSFLRWKVEYGVYLYPWMCYLCDKLHEPEIHSVHGDVEKWFMYDSACKKWTNDSHFIDVIR